MHSKNSAGFAARLLVLAALSILWISCNQSSTEDGDVTTAETDTSITEAFEMKPPGSIIPKDSAAAWINAYRRAGGGPFSTQVVIHHPDAVKFFMDSIFYKYTPKVELPKGYEWRVAFSPMFYRGKGGQKLSFCMVPCIVNTGVFPAEVFEFFTEMQDTTTIYKNYYLPLFDMIGPLTINGMKSDSTTRGFIFDEGQLWP